jgi:hypothetical protein
VIERGKNLRKGTKKPGLQLHSASACPPDLAARTWSLLGSFTGRREAIEIPLKDQYAIEYQWVGEGVTRDGKQGNCVFE